MKKFVIGFITGLTLLVGSSQAQMMGGMMQPYGYYPPMGGMGMMPMMGMRGMMPGMMGMGMMGMPMMPMMMGMMPMMGMGPMMPPYAYQPPMPMMASPVFMERMLYMMTMHPEAFKQVLKRNPELKRKLKEMLK